MCLQLSNTESFLCSFNQLDLPEYPSKQHLEERLLLAIHEANEGFGFGLSFFFGGMRRENEFKRKRKHRDYRQSKTDLTCLYL